jgi:hypothetical protein
MLPHNNAKHVKMVNSQEMSSVEPKDLDVVTDKFQQPHLATTKACTDLVNSAAMHACNADKDKD